jgi:hypothetical protein
MTTGGGPLHPCRDDGTVLDATFELSAVSVFELVYHHKVGGERAMNADYHEGLELLIARIGSVGAAILGVSVDSGVARELPPEERELPLSFPIEVDGHTDAHELRLEITRAVKQIARRPDANPGGGNDQKRIKMTLTLDRALDRLEAEQLLIGADSGGSSRTEESPPVTGSAGSTFVELSGTNRELMNAAAKELQDRFPHLWGSEPPAANTVVGFLANAFIGREASPGPLTVLAPSSHVSSPTVSQPAEEFFRKNESPEVLVLANENGRLRGRWHAPRYVKCPARAALRARNPQAEYMLVPLADAVGEGLHECQFCARFLREELGS